jgi:hypothetical protein
VEVNGASGQPKPASKRRPRLARIRRVREKRKTDFEIPRRLRKSQMRRHRQHRHGYSLPNNDDGRQYLHEILLVESLNPKATDKLLMNTIETVAPWMKTDEANTFIEHINRIPPKERWRDPVELGKILQVTNEERERLKLWTILPYDMTRDELDAQRKAKKRARARERRQRQPRAKYLAAHAVNRTKPWLALGISRATYYRRGETRM